MKPARLAAWLLCAILLGQAAHGLAAPQHDWPPGARAALALSLAALLPALAVTTLHGRSGGLAPAAGFGVGLACWLSLEALAAAAFGAAAWLLLWVWENERKRLREALAYTAAATTAGAIAMAGGWAPVAPVHIGLGVLALATAAALLLIDRRWPTDCTFCRATRAALAVNVAAIVAVLAEPGLFGHWPTDPPLHARQLQSSVSVATCLGAAIALVRAPAPWPKIGAISITGLAIHLPLAIAGARWGIHVDLLAAATLAAAVRSRLG